MKGGREDGESAPWSQMVWEAPGHCPGARVSPSVQEGGRVCV